MGGCVGIIPSASFQACADAFRAGAEDVIADPVHADDVSRCLGFLANGGLRRMEPMQVRPLQELERDAIVAALAACRGQVSLTARRLGIDATIVMPRDAPAVKLDATRDLGADIVLYDRPGEDRDEVAAQVLQERGGTLVQQPLGGSADPRPDARRYGFRGD